jgi:hypothetical protein
MEDKDVSTNLTALRERQYSDAPVRRNVSRVLVFAASLLLGPCAAAESGKKNDPFFSAAGGGRNGECVGRMSLSR